MDNMINPMRPESAEIHLVRRVPTAKPDDSVRQTIDRLRGRGFDCVELICVVDEQQRLLGLVPVNQLLAAPEERRVGELMIAPPPAAGVDLDQEHVATLARTHRLTALPIVDRNGCLLGCVPPAALIDINRHEHFEDISRLAGIVHGANHAKHALEAPPLWRVRHRLPWLLVGLAGSLVAASVVAQFEHLLTTQLAVAFFVPAIVYLADAIGTQSEAVVVRALSLGHLPLARILTGEVATGAMIGLVLGAIAWPCVYLLFGDGHLALAVAIAVVAAGSVATSCGLLLPWLLSHFGFDPAFGSGPVATVIQDVLSLIIYFLIVMAMAPAPTP
jgi:magnesium transporter